MEFRIGERVYCKSRSNWGVIVDKLSSATWSDYTVYILRMDGTTHPVQTTGDDLESTAYTEKTYSYDIKYDDGVVVAVLYEEYADGRKYELCRGHGHLLHNNAIGFAQAASYALKRIYTSMNGGSVRLDRAEDDYE